MPLLITNLKGYEPSDVIKLDILINGDPVDALSTILHRTKAERSGRGTRVEIEGAHSASDVSDSNPGGDRCKSDCTDIHQNHCARNVTAKMLWWRYHEERGILLEKQKEGKKRMKNVGQVRIPQEAFLAVLKTGD